MWICVELRDPATKASRGCLRVVELSAIPQLPPINCSREKSYYEKAVAFLGLFTADSQTTGDFFSKEKGFGNFEYRVS